MQRIEKPQSPNRFQTPPAEDEDEFKDWSTAETPIHTIAAIKEYSDYIDTRISGAINGSIPATPTLARIIAKRDKAQKIVVLTGVLSTEELDKRKAEDARKAHHKKEGGQRRVQTDWGVCSKGDGKLKIAGRDQFLAQERDRRRKVLEDRITKQGNDRWRVTKNAVLRWEKKWQDEGIEYKRIYSNWMLELIHFFNTGSRTMIPTDKA